jgi:hypothetical protein
VLGSRTEGREDKGWAVGVPVVLVTGERPDEDFETWRGAAATAGRPPSRRQEGETERGVKCAHWVGGRGGGGFWAPRGGGGGGGGREAGTRERYHGQTGVGPVSPCPPGRWPRTGPLLS